jgi:hypothetical protein
MSDADLKQEINGDYSTIDPFVKRALVVELIHS